MKMDQFMLDRKFKVKEMGMEGFNTKQEENIQGVGYRIK